MVETFADVLEHSFMDTSLHISFKLLGCFLNILQQSFKSLDRNFDTRQTSQFHFSQAVPFPRLHWAFDHSSTFLIVDILKFYITILHVFGQFHRTISLHQKLTALPRCALAHVCMHLLIHRNHSVESRWPHLSIRVIQKYNAFLHLTLN